jgi:hypothetical protein
MYSLKRLLWLAFVLTVVVLALIVTFGVRQFQLNRQYNEITSQSGGMIFRFATIREMITAGLIENSRAKLVQAIPELEKLHADIGRMEEQPSIPPQMRMAMVGRLDLAAIVISLRKLIDDEQRTDRGLQLQEQLRMVADQLLQYDRIIVGQARASIVDLQKTIIGIMGLGISLASIGLVYLYRNTLVPLLKLTEHLRVAEDSGEQVVAGAHACRELIDLTKAIEDHLHVCRHNGESEDAAAMTMLAETVNETTNQLNGIINYAQLLTDMAEEKASSPEEREMLRKIIDGGTRIAGIWRKIVT